MGEEAERGQWGRQLEFILTMIGYAVGLGNVWRFPFMCYENGGGAFLIPYVLCLIFLGIPMFALECSYGQYGGKGPLSTWGINQAFKGLGVSMVLTSTVIFIYYDIVIAWALRYLAASFTSDLPWIDCDSCDCLLYDKTNITSEEIEDLKTINSLNISCPNLDPDVTLSPSEIFFTQDVLADSGTIKEIGDLQWPLVLCSVVAFTVVFLVLNQGIKSLGKVVYVTAILPYILLTILLIRVAMLDGSLSGVKYYLTPRWERLKDAKVWKDAAAQIFFSLSACQGGLVAMSSYNKFNNNIVRDSFLVPIINCGTSFFAGFVVFSTLGYMSEVKNVPIENVTAGGAGLAFVVYPEAIGQMPVSTLWAILFFTTLCVLGFSSQFSIVETVMTSVIDEFPGFFRGHKMRNVFFRISVIVVGFLLGLPMLCEGGSHLFSLVDEAVLGFPLFFVGLFEYIVIIFMYGYKDFAEDLRAMTGKPPMFYFKVMWCGISPLLLTAVIIFTAYDGEEFEETWIGLLHYLIIVFILMWIPVGYFVFTCRNGSWELMRPKQEWRDRRQLSDHVTPLSNVTSGENGNANNSNINMDNLEISKDNGGVDNSGYASYESEMYPKTVSATASSTGF